VIDEIERVVVGKRSALTLILTTVLAGGHVLIEDLPGMGKTLIARSFCRCFGPALHAGAVHPDLLPADLARLDDLRHAVRALRVPSGPDLHEPADGRRDQPDAAQDAGGPARGDGRKPGQHRRPNHRLPSPFIVLATDNPIEYEGTYPLPEAQLDRFAVKVELKYLSERDEATMLRRRLDRGSAEAAVNAVVNADDLLAMCAAVEEVSVHEDVLHYVVSLATATRSHPQVAVGASPRAELDLVQLARARALVSGRDYVIPEDVKALAVRRSPIGSACGRRCGCAASTVRTWWSSC